MQYLLLIYHNEASFGALSEASAARSTASTRLHREHREERPLQGREELQPTSTATTVRVRNGKALTTDGPFAETREQLGGFYMIEAADLDEAIAIAARIPAPVTARSR